ncbi:hypothetical protein [Alteromonas sp. KUL49]|uniref:hypothetical protein n=1 Tax=Alteromonas sp. KUL49 TaxID=2480798 RepID=UPI00102F1889|nr:hypothetical protein [Alteromonas sp. KUL49]TAP42600.1 hypothetical protein EYS00_03040 [Alteromonas sp. KUL49]GEA10240.1 hypothetical protein KUL49_06150 [Alteromonas sp. KUL49]
MDYSLLLSITSVLCALRFAYVLYLEHVATADFGDYVKTYHSPLWREYLDTTLRFGKSERDALIFLTSALKQGEFTLIRDCRFNAYKNRFYIISRKLRMAPLLAIAISLPATYLYTLVVTM